MTLMKLPLLVLSSLLLVNAQTSTAGDGNFTISFFAGGENEACDAGTVDNAPTLTTETIPYGAACFNVSDIFGSSSDVGIQNDTSRGSVHPGNYSHPPQYVEYLLSNRDAYDPETNYTRIWLQHVNRGGKVKAGKPSTLSLWMYRLPDCMSTTENPSSVSSCQTKAEGECHELPYSMKSFSLVPNEEDKEDCFEWKVWGGAGPRLSQGAAMMAALAAGLVTYHIVL